MHFGVANHFLQQCVIKPAILHPNKKLENSYPLKVFCSNSPSGLLAVVRRIRRFIKESINVLKYNDSPGSCKTVGNNFRGCDIIGFQFLF